MKLTALKTLAFAAIALTALSSCKKDDKVEISVNGIAGTYKVVAATYKFNNEPEIDRLALMPACEKDNLLILNKDKSYVTQDVGTQCTPLADEDGTWDVPTSSKFVLDGNEATLNSFDGKVLTITVIETNGGDTETFKTTMNRQ